MCEMMGTPVDDSKLPIERSDLLLETQEVFHYYDLLQANWEGMSGSYMGKDLSLLPALFDQYEVEGNVQRYAWEIIPYIDYHVAEDIRRAQKAKSSKAGK